MLNRGKRPFNIKKRVLQNTVPSFKDTSNLRSYLNNLARNLNSSFKEPESTPDQILIFSHYVNSPSSSFNIDKTLAHDLKMAPNKILIGSCFAKDGTGGVVYFNNLTLTTVASETDRVIIRIRPTLASTPSEITLKIGLVLGVI